MADSSATVRADLVERHHRAMRDLNAYVVLLQDAIARSIGLNGTDVQVLGALMSGGPLTPGELARRTGITAGGAITAVVDRLERTGFVRRERGTQDRRTVVVTPVPEVVAASLGAIYGRIGTAWDAQLVALSDDQLRIVTETLEAASRLNQQEIARLRG